MNFPLTKDEKYRLAIKANDFLIRSGITSKQSRQVRESGDYAESEAGRDRRNMRRQAIARKREFLT